MSVIRFIKAAVYLLVTSLGMGDGPDIVLTDVAQAPGGGFNLGQCTVDGAGFSVLSISTGTGPTLETHFVGYWTQNPS